MLSKKWISFIVIRHTYPESTKCLVRFYFSGIVASFCADFGTGANIEKNFICVNKKSAKYGKISKEDNLAFYSRIELAFFERFGAGSQVKIGELIGVDNSVVNKWAKGGGGARS